MFRVFQWVPRQILSANVVTISWLLQGTLDVLNEILKEPVPMNRFRPKWAEKSRASLICTFCISCLGHLLWLMTTSKVALLSGVLTYHWQIIAAVPVLAFLWSYLISFDSILVDGCHPYSEGLCKTLKINRLTEIVVIFSPGVFSSLMSDPFVTQSLSDNASRCVSFSFCFTLLICGT